MTFFWNVVNRTSRKEMFPYACYVCVRVGLCAMNEVCEHKLIMQVCFLVIPYNSLSATSSGVIGEQRCHRPFVLQ